MAQVSLWWRLLPPCVTTDSSEKAEMDLLSPSREKFEVELRVDMRMGVGGVLPRGWLGGNAICRMVPLLYSR
jgi:hypothetical protein